MAHKRVLASRHYHKERRAPQDGRAGLMHPFSHPLRFLFQIAPLMLYLVVLYKQDRSMPMVFL